ncbi:hypothetical protein PVMG_05596 [Plasmodium vivax Mauritania I]|uniref:Variable surface protein n=1 Tax=Plasmodium vivax Mauritania I TaxID=1035515 RepID=A0A0J9TIG6_PLAVI|nr:hypothetical protein PVMG_05596 [Plasmodium vivax Mauritania I]
MIFNILKICTEYKTFKYIKNKMKKQHRFNITLHKKIKKIIIFIMTMIITNKNLVDVLNPSEDKPYSNCKTPNLINSQFNEQDCKAVMRYLNDLVDKINNNNIEKRCMYLYYWLYYNFFQKEKLISETLLLYNRLIDDFNTYNATSPCPKYINGISRFIFDEAEKLIELYTNFNKLNEIHKLPEDAYCECAKNCANSYMDYIKECDKYINKDFCNELENFRIEYNEYMSSVNKCPNVNKNLPSYKKFNIQLITLIPCSLIMLTSVIFFILYKVIIISLNIYMFY